MVCMLMVTMLTIAIMSHLPDSLPDSSVIDRLGGTGAVSRICEVSSQAVSKWRRTGIPKTQKKFLCAVYPEVFAEGPDCARRTPPARSPK